MIGKVIGAFVGDKLAKQTSGLGGAGGAALGVVAASVLRRMSLPAMLALGAGGYVAKKVFEKKSSEPSGTTTASEPEGKAKARKAA
ncbi:hypothetical protein K3165_09080 [Qipengyuania sp. 1XM1-15A]|uniref:hypothetical protein n=1 Tax=Qipengyuania xiamenensis TaxID=2867237 RepID=UPI001C870098|nr:hypothetical protein [Qipengyuania xiamenensis]MBX7533073.1 hypothetical protein [Qipengyuania xiamenensis]